MTSSRRVGVAVLLAVVAGAALAACSTDTPEVVDPDVCAAPERPPLQEGNHLLGDTPPPVPYSSTPPTSGWHAAGAGPPPGVYGSQLPDPQIVSVLEQGGVVVAHGAPLDRVDAAVAATLVAEQPTLVVTPYELDDGDTEVVLLAWGVLQRCDELDPDVVATFVAAHGGVDREP